MPTVLVADKFGRYVDATEDALALYGVTLEELRALEVGAFSGPYAELALTIWRRLARTGAPMPTGESTVYRPDGSRIRVRYVRIEPRPDETYEMQVVPSDVPATSDPPPIADNPTKVLEAWRAAERDVAAGNLDGAATSAEGLRRLYQASIREKARKPEPR